VIFEEREKLVFGLLQKLKDVDFVLIGGYAINAYTLPRFSVDCDLVVKNKEDAEKIAFILKEMVSRRERNLKMSMAASSNL